MSKLISFAWTTPALLAGSKTCTRRDWDPAYAARFHRGEALQAYDRSPRFKGRHVADIVLTADPVLEPICAMPPEDWAAEGFEWLHTHPEAISAAAQRMFGDFSQERFGQWRRSGVSLWVVRFKLVRVLEEVR